MAHRIIACIASEQDRASLIQGAGRRWHLEFHFDVGDGVRAARDETAQALVCELGSGSAADVRGLLNELARRRSPMPAVVRFDLSRAGIRELLALPPRLANVRLSLRGFDDVVEDLAGELSTNRVPTAYLPIVEQLAPAAPSAIRDIVIGAIFVGRRRRSVAALADVCGVSRRTLEGRLSAVGDLGARALLGWMLALHAAWDLDVLSRTVKRAAVEAGFENRAAFSNYLKRHTAMSPLQLSRGRGFATLLAQCASTVAGNDPPDRPKLMLPAVSSDLRIS
jgi:AraC-like DNA-binding protein